MRSVLVSKQMCFTESLLNEIKMKKTLSKHISFCPNTIKQITFICAITTSRNNFIEREEINGLFP